VANSDGGEQQSPTALLGPYHRVAGLLVIDSDGKEVRVEKVGKTIGPASVTLEESRDGSRHFTKSSAIIGDIVMGKASARCESRGSLREQRAVGGGAGATGKEREENSRALESEGGPRWSQARILSG